MEGQSKRRRTNLPSWNVGMIEQFLEVFEGFPVLWDLKLPEYHCGDHRESALQAMRVQLQEKDISVPSEEILKAKIKSIRATFRAELAKINQSRNKSSGAGVGEVYKPKLAWFNKANSFLNEVTSYRSGKSNLQENEVSLSTP